MRPRAAERKTNPLPSRMVSSGGGRTKPPKADRGDILLAIHSGAMHGGAMLRKELVAASAEPFILALLSKGESYGYAIIQEIMERSQHRIEWTDGMLYPVLHRMERKGWIKSRWSRKRHITALSKALH